MAKRGGFFSTLGSLWRLTIWGLAALFVVAVWIWYTGDGSKDTVTATDETADATPARAPETPESVAAEEAGTPEPATSEAGGAALQQGTGLAETRPVDGTGSTPDTSETAGRAEETPESVAAEEAGTPEPNPAETGGAALQQGTGLAETRPVDGSTTGEAATATGTGAAAPSEGTAADAAQGATEAASGTASEETITAPNPAETGGAAIQQGTGLEGTRPVEGAALQGQGNAAAGMVTGAVEGAVNSASEAVSGSGAATALRIPKPAPMTAIDVIGDNTATYAFVDAVKGENGGIELTTARTENGTTLYVTRRVSCDPLAAVVVAEGPNRDAMEPIDTLADPGPVAEGSPEAALASYACSLEF